MNSRLSAVALVCLLGLAGCTVVPEDRVATGYSYVEFAVSNADDAAHNVTVTVTDANNTTVHGIEARLPPGFERNSRYNVARNESFHVTFESGDGAWRTDAAWESAECDPFVVRITVDDDGWESHTDCEEPTGGRVG